MMTALCWVAVTLSLLMSAGNRSVAGDQDTFPQMVKKILDMYRPSYWAGDCGWWFPMYSLAVSIPYVKDKFDTSQVAATDPGNDVKKAILKCDVYIGKRVVAATVLKWSDVLYQCPHEAVQWPGVLKKCKPKVPRTWAEVQSQCPLAVYEGKANHAEYRTLQHFNTLTKNLKKKDFMLFYVRSSPCGKRCTDELNPLNILDSIKEIKKWDNYAVVFSNVFKPRSGDPIPKEDRLEALEQLGRSVGLNNIYRCTGNNAMQCKRCYWNSKVDPFCYSD